MLCWLQLCQPNAGFAPYGDVFNIEMVENHRWR